MNTHKKVTWSPFIPFPFCLSSELCQYLKPRLFPLWDLSVTSIFPSTTSPPFTSWANSRSWVPRSLLNHGGRAQFRWHIGLGQNDSLPFLSKPGNSGNTGDIPYLCSLYKVLNVICGLHSMSIQKILTIMKKRKRQWDHVIVSVQPLPEKTF